MTTSAVSRTLATATRRALPLMVPALLGLALLGVVGFAPYPAAHDAMHDIRHAAGFPCH
jgi:cobalt transporter subunit CbtB